MKKQWLALALVGALTSGAAFAQQAPDGPWLVRARAVHLDSVNKDSTGLGLSINDKVLPEVDITYFFSPNIAAELILTVPQKQKLRADGLGQIGTLKHLPPALLAQYHFTQWSGFKPYVGASPACASTRPCRPRSALPSTRAAGAARCRWAWTFPCPRTCT